MLLASVVAIKIIGVEICFVGDAMAIVQHHDAVRYVIGGRNVALFLGCLIILNSA